MTNQDRGPLVAVIAPDDCGSGDKFTYAMDGHLNGMCDTPQEIPAAEAIKRLLDGEVLDAAWKGCWYSWRVRDGMFQQRWDDE